MKMLSHIDQLLRKEVKPVWVMALSGIFSFSLFGLLLLKYRIIQPDLQLHIQASIDLVDGKVMGHPVFFFLIQLLSGFSENEDTLIFSSFLVFSLSQFFKIVFTLRFMEVAFKIRTSVLLFAGVLMAQLVISNSFLQEHYVMGSLSPNYFHNGTLLLCMPFVMLFLIENYRYFEDGERKHIFRMLLLGVCIVFIKPSFLFCWIPVMPCLWFWKYRVNPSILGILQVAVLLVVIIIFQSQLIKSGASGFKVVFNPFGFFGTYSNHLRVTVASVFFPLSVFLLFSRSFLTNETLKVFFFFMLQGLIISFFFYDTINGLISPNMLWQSSIMSYLMIIACLGLLLKESKNYLSFRALACFTAFLIHFICGVRYLQMAIANKSFFI